MDDIIRIIKSPENSSVLIDRVSEKVTYGIKKQGGEFFGMLLRTLIASVPGNMLTGKSVMRARKRDVTTGKGTMRAERGYNMDKNCEFCSIL